MKKWQDGNNQEQIARARLHFEKTWTLIEMSVKQAIIRMRKYKGNDVLWSETHIKMDFPVERLTPDCWQLIGDRQGVRMLVVDLEQATEDDEFKQDSSEKPVELIDMTDD